jgi:hypothetical protein
MGYWKDLNSRKRFLIIFGLSSFISLAVVSGIGVFYISYVTDSIESKSRSSLSSQTNENSNIIVTKSTDLFEKTLLSATENFVQVYMFAMADVYRNSYSMGFSPSYYDWTNDFLAPPLVDYPPYPVQVSLVHSSYYVPGTTPDDIPDFSTTLNTTRDLSANLDPYFRPSFRDNADFAAGYVALDIPSENSAIFRHYPGVSTLTTDPNREYDPRIRGWYQDALANPNKAVYTSPYADFQGKGWMISISRAIKNVNTGEVVGVAGSDMLIQIIQDNINSIQFLESGKATLFQIDGVVVSDPEWTPDPLDQTGFMYTDLKNPAIDDELWLKISESDLDQTVTDDYHYNGVDYKVVHYRSSEFDGRYVMVITVPKSEIFSTIDEIVKEMDSTSKDTIGLVAGIFVACILISGLLTFLLVNIYTRPISQVKTMTANMNQQLGRGDLTEGLDQNSARATGIAEVDELIGNFQAFSNRIRANEQAKEKEEELVQNEWYGQEIKMPNY